MKNAMHVLWYAYRHYIAIQVKVALNGDKTEL